MLLDVPRNPDPTRTILRDLVVEELDPAELVVAAAILRVIVPTCIVIVTICDLRWSRDARRWSTEISNV